MAIVLALLPYLIQAGTQLVPLVEALIKYMTDAKTVNRADISDADFKALEDVIRLLQGQIDAVTPLAPAALAAQIQIIADAHKAAA